MTPALHAQWSAPAPAAQHAALPVALLHGWGMNLKVFDRLREQLHPRPSLAIDLPGHGQSPWWSAATGFEIQCQSVLDVLPPRCVLAGWSLGAKLAMALAAQAPQRVAALVLLSPTPKFARSADWPQGMDQDVIGNFRALLGRDWRRVLSDFAWLQVRGSRDAESAGQVLEAALARHGAPVPDALLAGLALLEQLDLRDLVAGIAQPTLVVTGLNDRVTLPDAARWLVRRMPQATLFEVPRAGHAPFVSHHLEVAVAIREFIAGQGQYPR